MLISALTSLAELQTAPSLDKERRFFMLICLAFVIEHANASPRCGLREPKHVSVEIFNVELLHAVEGIVQVAYNFTLRLQSGSERFQIVDLEIQHGTAADVGGIRKGGDVLAQAPLLLQHKLDIAVLDQCVDQNLVAVMLEENFLGPHRNTHHMLEAQHVGIEFDGLVDICNHHVTPQFFQHNLLLF